MSVNLKPAVNALRNADKLVEGTKLRVLKDPSALQKIVSSYVIGTFGDSLDAQGWNTGKVQRRLCVQIL